MTQEKRIEKLATSLAIALSSHQSYDKLETGYGGKYIREDCSRCMAIIKKYLKKAASQNQR